MNVRPVRWLLCLALGATVTALPEPSQAAAEASQDPRYPGEPVQRRPRGSTHLYTYSERDTGARIQSIWHRHITTEAPEYLAGLHRFSMYFGRWRIDGAYGFLKGIDFDREIKEISAMHEPEQGQAHFVMADQFPTEQFDVRAEYVALPEGSKRRQASLAKCNGTCSIPIGRPRDGEVFVLRGFKFQRHARDDANLRKMAIAPRPEQGKIEVTFVDNDSTPAYSAQIQYAYVPQRWVKGVHHSPLTSTTKDRPGVRQGSREPGRAVLRGFSLEFTNGDHRLAAVGAGICEGSQDCVTGRLEDNDRNDPTKMSIDYVVLRDRPLMHKVTPKTAPRPMPSTLPGPMPTKKF